MQRQAVVRGSETLALKVCASKLRAPTALMSLSGEAGAPGDARRAVPGQGAEGRDADRDASEKARTRLTLLNELLCPRLRVSRSGWCFCC